MDATTDHDRGKTMTTTKTETRETTRDGYDLIMTREREGWMCSVYRTGKSIPLARRLIPGNEERAAKWLDGMAASMAAALIGKGGK